MSDLSHVQRLHTNDLELGATEAIQKHYERHVVSTKAVSQRKLDFERARPRWLREMMAEAHFNPAMTICFATWQGFPWKKVPYYIFAQIFGAFMAGLFVYGQYHEQIVAYSAATIAAGKGTVFNGGPASIFCSFPGETQTNLGYLFMIEFFVDSYIGIVIWAFPKSTPPKNLADGIPTPLPLNNPTNYILCLAYSTMVWAFADITISTNMARDLGTRLVALIFFGREAFTYHSYSWISILVNIPATLFATAYYEMLMRDSLQKIGKGAAVHEHGEEGLNLHLTKSGISGQQQGPLSPGMQKVFSLGSQGSTLHEGHKMEPGFSLAAENRTNGGI
ncbi:aquaporin-like protein [Aureobasidium pullulans]|nr:aquaporin-like protein [Aureobasidium pullulans]